MKKVFLLSLATIISIGFGSLTARANSSTGQDVQPLRLVKQQGRIAWQLPEKEKMPNQMARAGKGIVKAPMLVAGDFNLGGAILYGWSSYSTVDPVGLYKVGSNGITQEWVDQYFMSNDVDLYNGIIVDGKLYGNVFRLTPEGSIRAQNWLTYDAESGELLSATDCDLVNDAPTFHRMTYNPNDGYIYGVGYIYSTGGAMQFFKTTIDNPQQAEVIKSLEDFYETFNTMCYNAKENLICGFDLYGDFIKMNLNGEIVSTYYPDNIPWGYYNYPSGMVYSEEDDAYYWEAVGYDGSFLCMLQVTGETEYDVENTVLYQLPNDNQLLFFATATPNLLAPQKAVMTEFAFLDGQTSGYIEYTIPSYLQDGVTPIAADNTLIAVASVDGIAQPDVIVTPGQTMRVDYSSLSEGNHIFKLMLSYNGQTSTTSCYKYVGYDTPKAPENVTLSNELTVSWDPVTEGVNGGFVDSDVEYNIYLNGEFVDKTNETSYQITIPDNSPMASYVAEVSAVNHGHESAKTASEAVVAGEPYLLPFTVVPTASQALVCTIIDANGDDNTWMYDDENNLFAIGYAWGAHDDMLLMPAFRIEDADQYYQVFFDAAYASRNYKNEKIDIYVGKTTNKNEMTLIEQGFTPQALYPEFATGSVYFKVDEPGVYYLGFNCVSNDQMGCALKNITVTGNNIYPQSPANLSDLEVEAGQNGELVAYVTFTLPTEDMEGNVLDPSTEITVTVSGEYTASVTGFPGESKTVQVNTVQGDNKLAVTPSIGEYNGLTEYVNVYTGVVIPETPQNVTKEVAPDMLSVTFNWDPVTTGVDGGYVNPEEITYDVYILKYYSDYADWVKLANTGTATSYEYVLPEDEMRLANRTFAIAAVNAAGASAKQQIKAWLGPGVTIPWEESQFTTGDFEYSWYVTGKVNGENNPNYSGYALTDAEWLSWDYGITLPDYLNDNPNPYLAISFRANHENKFGVSTPELSTKNVDKAYIEFTLASGEILPETRITATYYGCEEPVEIATIPAGSGDAWDIYTFDLPAELMGRDWIRIIFDCTFDNNDQYFVLNSFAVRTGSMSSVETIELKTGITGGIGTINITGNVGNDLIICNINGQVVLNKKVASDYETFNIDKGIYIVKCGSTACKVMVR